MTQFEVNDLAASIMANFLGTFTIFITIVTAYVITAFVAGRKLTRIQLMIINTAFLASISLVGYQSMATYQRADAFAKQNEAVSTAAPPVDLSWFIVLLYFGLMVGCFAFMNNVRNSNRADDT